MHMLTGRQLLSVLAFDWQNMHEITNLMHVVPARVRRTQVVAV
jgi:hypothetical protein